MNKPFAVLTGASKGIGYATAEWLAKNGYDLLICSRTTDEAGRRLSAYGTEIIPVNGSIGEESTLHQIENIIKERKRKNK